MGAVEVEEIEWGGRALRKAFPDCVPSYLARLAIVTANGRVLREGDGGLVVTDFDGGLPLALIDDVSDEAVSRICLEWAAGASRSRLEGASASRTSAIVLSMKK